MKSNIPSYLTTPSTSQISPPVNTRIQELPYHKLEWVDFEKLCYRVVKIDSNVEHCQQFGTKGQEQLGIDIYARKQNNDKYDVYQCKRVRNFTPRMINEIVEKFLDGDWKSKSSSFILFASLSLKSTSLTSVFEENVKKLEGEGIKFVKFDADELNYILKNQSKIVDDFFSREWVRLFCGEEAAAHLNLRKRLDSSQVIEYRKKLGEFYNIVFNTYDPGIPSLLLEEKIPIEERFILPDIIEKEEIYFKYKEEGKKELSTQSDEHLVFNNPDEGSTLKPAPVSDYFPKSIEKRISVEDWLVQNERSIILGEPGSGKSTLIRYIIIDLLQESPRLSKLSEKWGCYLPIWIPFALCSKKISKDADISIKEILHAWFKSNGHENLFILVEQALEDERLLLLIDGLDEWTDELSAKTAFDRINIFIEDKKIPVMVTSRPYGYKKLENKISNAKITTLAPFSYSQQTQLSLIWFMVRLKYALKDTDKHALSLNAEKMSSLFIEELRRASSINDLAKVPMLLCILIALKMQDVVLPQSRFQAYEEILEYLITKHPQRRLRDSNVGENSLNSYFEDDKIPFSLIANYIQNNSLEGLIEKETAKTIIRDFFVTEYGNSREEAIRKSMEVINISETSLGILVERSQLELGFFHRSFQEYLTAYRLSKLDIDQQTKIICSNINNHLWREVILCFFYLIKRPSELKGLIETIRNLSLNEKDKYYVNLIIYEIVFGKFECPYSLRKKIAEEAFNDIETHFWNSYRENVLITVIEGLNSPALKELIETKIRIWFPNRISWRKRVFDTFNVWENKKEAIPCLLKNLFDEEIENKLSAAHCLAEISGGDILVGKRLANMALKELDLNTRAAAFEALLHGWLNNEIIDQFIRTNSDSSVSVLRFMSIKGNVKKKKGSEKDLDDLLKMLSYGDIDHHWHNLITDCILEGWKGNSSLKEKCLFHKRLNSSTFKNILIKGFPNDKEIAIIIKNTLEDKNYSFSPLDDSWQWIGKNFKNSELLCSVVENLILNRGSFHNREMYYITPIAKTEKVKNKLIKSLDDKDSFQHWTVYALLENWGMEDSDVATTLTNLVSTNVDFASKIGHLLPQIILDKVKCKEKLIELIKNPASKRQDFILEGIIRLNVLKYDDPLIDYILDDILTEGRIWMMLYEDIISKLVINFSENKRIQELVLNNITKLISVLPSISLKYNNKPELREELISYCTPLPKNLRIIISSQLGERVFDQNFANNILSKYSEEIDPNIKIQTSKGYYENIIYNSTDFDLDKLLKELIKLGPAYEEIREAAFCGAIIIARPELIKETKYKTDYSIHLGYGFDDRPALVRFLLENWKYLNDNFNEEIWKILDLDPIRVWTVFSNYINEFPYAKEKLIKFIETAGIKEYELPLLHLISDLYPKSKFLLDCCLESIKGRSSVDAGYILGTQFDNDENVFQLIYQRKETLWHTYNDGSIVALCKGWGNKSEFEKIYKELEKPRIGFGVTGEIFLICAKSPAENVLNKICDLIEKHYGLSDRLSIKEIVERLRKDKNLETLIIDKLFITENVDQKVTFINLLNKAMISRNDLKEWYLKEINNQEDMVSPQIGYDFTENNFKSILASILNSTY